MASKLCQSISLYAQTKASNHWNRTFLLQIKKHRLVKETHKRSISLTSSPATTSRMVTNDWEKLICTISSLVNNGILSSRMTECNLAIFRAQRKRPNRPFWTQFSHLTRRIIMKIEGRTETRKCEISLTGNPHAGSKISLTIPFSFSSNLFTKPKFLPQNFCSTAVGLLSSRSNFVSKHAEIKNLQQRIFESDWLAQKKKYLEEKIPSATQNNNRRQKQ